MNELTNAKVCSIPHCGRHVLARGMCRGHYTRWRTTGSAKLEVPLLDQLRIGKFVTIDGKRCYEVPLPGGIVSIVDEQDSEFAMRFNWRACHGRHVFRTDENRQNQWLHREIMQAPEHLEVDHENRNGLDNRRENLRLATRPQNGANRGMHPGRLPTGKSSKFRGVSFYKPRGVWQAQITYNGKNSGLGHFLNEKDAAIAYDAAAKEKFGEFAVLNFP